MSTAKINIITAIIWAFMILGTSIIFYMALHRPIDYARMTPVHASEKPQSPGSSRGKPLENATCNVPVKGASMAPWPALPFARSQISARAWA